MTTDISARDNMMAEFVAAFMTASTPRLKSRPRSLPGCHVRGHGLILRRSDAMGDSYCPDCRVRQSRVYGFQATPGRRIVLAEAAKRGGTCQFMLVFPDEPIRCQARFSDGLLEWHHRDPKEKIATISSLADGSNREVLIAELAKCDLLCRGHHRIVQRSRYGDSRWLIATSVEAVSG